VFLVVVIVGSVVVTFSGFGLKRYGRALLDDRAPAIAEVWINSVTVLFVLLALGGIFVSVGQLPGAEGTAQTVGLKIGFVLLGLGGLYLAAMGVLARVAGLRVPR
jgi:hypothetical protein